jgi:uncharacterized membrane protein YphA (DoxX/SURF4 family)
MKYDNRPTLAHGKVCYIEIPAKSEVTMNYALWIIQCLLALLFLWAGGIKLVLPLDQLAGPIPLPGWFIRLIGVFEVLGALGLILPGLLRIKPELAMLAPAGLVIIMIGATVLTIAGDGGMMAIIPLAVGLLLAFVAAGRWKLARDRGSGVEKLRGKAEQRV